MTFDHRKYRPFPAVGLVDRQWPDRRIETAPQWCSVDLRDGNQALIEPMSPARKMILFELLVDIGFTQIEVGFPAASKPDFDFVRRLIDEDRIPDTVRIQVLTQARPEIVRRTFEAVKGARNVIMHLYNPTSVLHRETVFKLGKPAIKRIALNSAEHIRVLAAAVETTDWTFQYSLEGFTDTELEFAADICNGVAAIWQPTPERPMTVTLPATVETATPNVYADQVEWMCRSLKNRDAIVVGTHTHNDRGCAVAAAELAVMAGAQRVEGTLLGNGERCGNMDILVMAMNLYSQGIDPGLDLSAIDRIASVVTACTHIDVHPRHPYCGDLVFTAFSGGHQDAISKCLEAGAGNAGSNRPWAVTYLPIDPQDVGRSYQDVIRINSQSGKGGVTHVLEARLGVRPPRWLQIDFSRIVQANCEDSGGEIGGDAIWTLFRDRYLGSSDRLTLDRFAWIDEAATDESASGFAIVVGQDDEIHRISGDMRDPTALVQRLATRLRLRCDLLDFTIQPLATPQNGQQHGGGTIAYVCLLQGRHRHVGVAIGASPAQALILAALKAMASLTPSGEDAFAGTDPRVAIAPVAHARGLEHGYVD